jgi:hypothetical protein
MWRCRSRDASVTSPGSVSVRNRPKCISRVARLETVLGLQVASFSSRYAVMAEAIAGVMPASRPANGTGFGPESGGLARIPRWNRTRWVKLSPDW